MYEHRDVLENLNKSLPLREKLVHAHRSVQETYPFIVRIAIALYDPATRVLKAFLHSSDDESPLEHYQALLSDAPMLKDILDKGRPRIINNMLTIEDGEHEHTRRIGRAGYAASYTLPIF